MDPEASRLCPLWEELTQLEDDNSVLPPALSSAPCPFSSNPTSSFSLCQLWCGVQAYSGIRCEEPCPAPYIGDPEEEALCDLWQELETHMETTGPLTNFHIDSLPGVLCPHTNNPTSADALCDLWCQVEPYLDSRCHECPSEYMTDPAADLLCDLWTQLQLVQKGQMEGTVAKPTTASNPPCISSNHSTSAEPLCDVWCELQKVEHGNMCVECPTVYQLDPEGNLLCQLWTLLFVLEESNDLTTIPSPQTVSCLFKDNPTSSAALCSLWCQVSV